MEPGIIVFNRLSLRGAEDAVVEAGEEAAEPEAIGYQQFSGLLILLVSENFRDLFIFYVCLHRVLSWKLKTEKSEQGQRSANSNNMEEMDDEVFLPSVKNCLSNVRFSVLYLSE